MAQEKMLVVMESGVGGAPNREPRCIIPLGSSEQIHEFMRDQFQAEHDARYVEAESRHFNGSRWGRSFELQEVQVTHLN